MEDKTKIAMFIDADNAPAAHIQNILTELAKYGVVNIRRAYGNWHSENLKSWREVLHECAIRAMQQFDVSKGKNATDMAMTIDVMDVLHGKDVDIICIVSSDSDFTPLVIRCLEEGKKVIGFGERKTPPAFVSSCSRFLYLDTKHSVSEHVAGNSKQSDITEQKATIQKPHLDHKLKQDKKLMELLKRAVEALEDESGWASLSAIGSHISNHSSFDQRNYGYKKLSDLFKAIDLFEVKASAESGMFVKVR